MKNYSILFCVFCTFLFGISLNAQSPLARIQVIHNSPDKATQKVDIYLNDKLLLDDFTFRTATPFVNAPAGEVLKIDVLPSTSTSSNNPIYTISPTLTEGSKYVLIADGIVSSKDIYFHNNPFSIEVYDMGRETAIKPTNTDVLVHHGMLGIAPLSFGNANTFPAKEFARAQYAGFNGYTELPTKDFRISITTLDIFGNVGLFSAPFEKLGFSGKAVTIIASGFVNPEVNSNGPTFGLWVALPTGGALVELIPEKPVSGIQIIHNSADKAVEKVDIYLNKKLFINDLAFRNASPIIEIPSGQIIIDVTASTSTSAENPVFSQPGGVVAGRSYTFIMNGILSKSGYEPAVPLGFNLYLPSRETASAETNTDVLIHHGSTDAPTVVVSDATTLPSNTLVNNLSYGNFSFEYLELFTSEYIIDVSTTKETVIQKYTAPLKKLGLDGKAITVVASGFFNRSKNSNGPAFGLWAALPTGGPLVELPVVTSLNTNEFEYKNLSVSPNPTNNILNINFKEFNNTKAVLFDVQGRNVLETKLNNEITPLDVSNLQKGMYVLKISSADNANNKAVKVLVK
jgi:hypothetical protein